MGVNFSASIDWKVPTDLTVELQVFVDDPATATARTDCELVPVDEHRFGFLVQQTPFYALHVMRVLVERLRETNRLLKAS